MSRCALVTGIGGQDGSLLAELLLAEGYRVCGVVRSLAAPLPNLAAIGNELELHELELADGEAVRRLLGSVRPDEVYNLAAVSLVPRSWEEPRRTLELGVLGAAALLDAVLRVEPGIRLFQASSAEIFGEASESPQTELTVLAPRTPYGVAKASAQLLVGCYRAQHGLHASAGILFAHESPRRPPEFVTRKVSRAAAMAHLRLLSELPLGNLSARRDWGAAEDSVRAMWLMLQAEAPDDYVVATGEAHSVEELCALAFGHVGLDWREFVRVDESLLRGQADVGALVGDASKARARLGWRPTIGFDELVRRMVDADLALLRAGAAA